MSNNNNNKKPGLAKDDEDVRVQSTNDEATVARACVLSDFVLHLFLSNSREISFFLSFFLSVRAHPSATYRTTRTPFCLLTGQKFGETNRCTI